VGHVARTFEIIIAILIANLERLKCIFRAFKVHKVIDYQFIFLAGFTSYSKCSIRYISETSEQMLITRYRNQVIPLFESNWILKKTLSEY